MTIVRTALEGESVQRIMEPGREIFWNIPYGEALYNLNLILAPGIGYTIGEVVSLSVNRKRGKGLAAIAGCAVIISYLIGIFSPWGLNFSLSNILFLILDLVALGLGIFIAVTRLR